MIEWLKKSYDHIPRQPREKERALHVSKSYDAYRFRLVIYLEGSSLHVGHQIDLLAYESAKYNVEEDEFTAFMRYAKHQLNT